MWVEGCHTTKPTTSWIEDLAKAEGALSDEDAQIWFAKFCEKNLFFTVKLLTGVELDPYQEIKLRGFFLRDFCLNIEGRGIGKSFTISLYIILYALFNPGCKIGILSGTFRQSKLIFKQIEKWINSKHGKYLRQCIPGGVRTISHSNDGFEMKIGESSVMALPLTEKIRGLRFNKVIIDEYLLMTKEMVESIIRPFLTAKQSDPETEKVRKLEDDLISKGIMRESDRKKVPNNSIIALSSASFKFEDLYKNIFEVYCKKISDPKAENVNHFVFRVGYEAVEGFGRIDTKLINEAKDTSSFAQFNREYRAIFTDEGTGYFKHASLEAATVGMDCEPMIKIKGDPSKKYILGIDPNYSESETADHFAMALLEFDDEKKTAALVHAYALANSKISKRADYLNYLLKNFNIVYIIVDNAGGLKFVSDASQFLGGFSKEITEFPNTLQDGSEGVKEARKNYNYSAGRILHSQVFNKSDWIRLANENLQVCIEKKKILFGGAIGDAGLKIAESQNIQVEDLEFKAEKFNEGAADPLESFTDHLNYLVDLTKKELTLIDESRGFNLPLDMKDTKNPTRVRRDSYTALLLAAWGLHCYEEIMKEEVDSGIFIPMWIA